MRILRPTRCMLKALLTLLLQLHPWHMHQQLNFIYSTEHPHFKMRLLRQAIYSVSLSIISLSRFDKADEHEEGRLLWRGFHLANQNQATGRSSSTAEGATNLPQWRRATNLSCRYQDWILARIDQFTLDWYRERSSDGFVLLNFN